VWANILTEKSLEPGRFHYMGYVSVLAVVAFFGFRWACLQFGLGVASGVVDSLLTLLTLAYAVFVLGEDLTRIQYAGLAFILVGLFLVKGPLSGPPQKAHSATPEAVETSQK
jgi:drug/metabolite transporter (DMT)-like permease